MSTFNGERYVAEQLESILKQLPSDGRILVRDDGSTDGTTARVETFDEARLELIHGTNLGFGASFLTLLAMAPPDADLVMFSDQDDVWLPGKLERAWKHLQPLHDVPALYGSAQMLVDEELRPLHATSRWPRGPSLINALFENIITGCTAVLNRPAVELLKRAVPSGVSFHDWWMYLVISAFGEVVFDDEPTVLYRQHGGNHIGHGVGRIGRYAGIVRFLLRHDWIGTLLGQVAALIRIYGDQLGPDKRLLILNLFDIRDQRAVPRWRMIFRPQRFRQRLAEDLALRLLMLLHRLNLWPLNRRTGAPNQ